MPRVKVEPGMTGEELVAWRESQPGEYEARNGEIRTGWSQEQAAKWYGVSTRQWQRYESGETGVPLPLVRRIQAYRVSWEEAVDRIFDTPRKHLDEWGSPFEALKGDNTNDDDE